MHVIIVISLDMPDPEGLAQALEHINPPGIPHFAGQVRVAIDPPARDVIDYLEGRRDDLPRHHAGASCPTNCHWHGSPDR